MVSVTPYHIKGGMAFESVRLAPYVFANSYSEQLIVQSDKRHDKTFFLPLKGNREDSKQQRAEVFFWAHSIYAACAALRRQKTVFFLSALSESSRSMKRHSSGKISRLSLIIRDASAILLRVSFKSSNKNSSSFFKRLSK